MVSFRTLPALLALLALIMLGVAPAQAQRGGIQVAPVLITLSEDRAIGSLRIHNGRDRPVAFEIDAFAWSQDDGADMLTATNALIVAPGVFEIPPGGDQVIRIGARDVSSATESSFRILIRELPRPRSDGATIGFALEMSVPVFMSPRGARSQLIARTESRDGIQSLVLTNTGQGYAQIGVDDTAAGVIPGPRYLLAGESAVVSLPPQARTVRLRAADAGGALQDRHFNVDPQTLASRVR